MSFKALTESFSNAKSEVKIQANEQEFTFYVHKIGFLKAQEIGKFVGSEDRSWLALLIAEAITDQDGIHLSYEQALELPRDIFQTFFDAVVAQNDYLKPQEEGAEKN